MQHQKQVTKGYKGYEIKLKSNNQPGRLYMPACKRVNVWTRVHGQWLLYMQERVCVPTHPDAIRMVFNIVKKRIDGHFTREGGFNE